MRSGTSPCLSRAMRAAGHSLDWGCSLCDFNCLYAAPCGCGSPACVDQAGGADGDGVATTA